MGDKPVRTPLVPLIDKSNLWTLKAAAKKTGVAESTIRNAIREGRIACYYTSLEKRRPRLKVKSRDVIAMIHKGLPPRYDRDKL